MAPREMMSGIKELDRSAPTGAEVDAPRQRKVIDDCVVTHPENTQPLGNLLMALDRARTVKAAWARTPARAQPNAPRGQRIEDVQVTFRHRQAQ
jgi:hypothetical protein